MVIAVNKSDGRQKAAAAWLQKNGFSVISAGTSAQADVLMVQMPFCPSIEELECLVSSLKAGGLVLAGMPSESASEWIFRHGYYLQDYARCEDFVMLNAVPTAEACLNIMMTLRKKTIWKSKILITGFGRIAKLVARHCKELGAEVTVAARSAAQRAEAEAWGCDAIPLQQLEQAVQVAEVIVNTAPALVFSQKILKQVSEQCLLIDLASSPGGFDFEAAERLGLQLEWARGLPPKHTPDTAGEILGKTIKQILLERGEFA